MRLQRIENREKRALVVDTIRRDTARLRDDEAPPDGADGE